MPKSSPSTDNYTLGKGILYIASYGSSVFTDLGNCSNVELEPAIEQLDHFSSRSGTRSKDKSITIEKSYTVAFTLDELSVENLALFMRATHTGNAEIQGLMASDVEHILKFESNNGTGPDYSYVFHRVKISPSGGMGLISEEWTSMEYSAEGLEDTTTPLSPWFTVTSDATTTTTTSSSTTSSSTTSSSTTTTS